MKHRLVPGGTRPVHAVCGARHSARSLSKEDGDRTRPARPDPMSDILSDMKTVTLRALRRDASLLEAAGAGEEIVVTRFGKPDRACSAAAFASWCGDAFAPAGARFSGPDSRL
jgi:hypothetical protein